MANDSDFSHLAGNPAFQNYVKSLVAKEVRDVKLGTDQTKNRTPDQTPVKGGNCVIKSPSDTTIYAPLLKRNTPNTPVNRVNMSDMNNQMERITVNDISNFIEGIRQRTPVRTATDVQTDIMEAGPSGKGSRGQDR